MADTPGEAVPTPTPTPARRRRDRERAAARASILAAAHDLARREGWDAVTMRRLANEIEYSPNFAYRYFTGREDILLALARDGFNRLREAMHSAGQSTTRRCARDGEALDAQIADTNTDAAAAVRRAGHAYLDFALTEPDLYQLMYGLGGVRVPATDTWSEGQAVGDVLTDLLAATGDERPDQHVLQLWATAHGLIALRVVGRVDVDTAALHALLDEALADCLTRAFPDRRPPPPSPFAQERASHE
jgi:AcrR family transcriptional regulator